MLGRILNAYFHLPMANILKPISGVLAALEGLKAYIEGAVEAEPPDIPHPIDQLDPTEYA